MSLSKKWGKTRIYHNTILALENPEYIRLLFNPKKKKLAIQLCTQKKAERFKVPYYNSDKWDFCINSKPLLSMIWKCCSWEPEKTYRLSGELYVQQKLIEFDLDKAMMLEEDDLILQEH